MTGKRSKAKSLIVLLVTMLLGIAVTACGSTSKSVVSTSSNAVATAGTTTAASTQGTSHKVPSDDVLHGGHAATEPDKREITGLVKRYYAAAAADDGATACTLLTSAMAKSIPEDYGGPSRPALRGKTCSVVMSKIFKHPYGVSVPDLSTTKVIGVHINGNRGIAWLHSGLMPRGEMGVEREHVGDPWRVNVPIGAVN